jgi:hypothetical protein
MLAKVLVQRDNKTFAVAAALRKGRKAMETGEDALAGAER